MTDRTEPPPESVNPQQQAEDSEAAGFTWEYLLYRLYGDDDDLLYIGRTNNLSNRFKQHAKAQPGWDEVRRSAVETWPNFLELCRAERKAIIVEQPRYNVIYNVSSRTFRAALPPETPRWRGLSHRLDAAADMLHGRTCALRHWPDVDEDEPTCEGCAAEAWGVLKTADAQVGHFDLGLSRAVPHLPQGDVEEWLSWSADPRAFRPSWADVVRRS